MIKYTGGGKCQQDLIEGHDLMSKFEFMRSVRTSRVQLNEECRILGVWVFDLIREVAVNEYLKAGQMIKKVIMFTNFLERPDSRIWGIQYDALRSNFEAIRNKFRDKGYGDDVVPHILYFNEHQDPWICTQHPGFTISWKQPSLKIIKLSRTKGSSRLKIQRKPLGPATSFTEVQSTTYCLAADSILFKSSPPFYETTTAITRDALPQMF
ncbi:unnamed protein product [Prunus armeniaca]|uniref:DUF7788 domain-containing protein n=1 Tax=Prunus armeniaca TaxID=36596 RepID=A0A6J5VF46_PRUAR|nr:unnamed protein product [Prunus armeniaca]CAB4317152.1 unnamed protein product [Prunus armeniaca]